MATVSAKVFDHHRKADGTYNVKICVQHKRLRKYLDTTHFVVRKQLPKDFKVKYPFIADKVEKQLRDYRKIISELDDRLEYFTAESLRDYLRDKDEDVDFIKFCNQHIERLRQEKRRGTANNHRKIRNSLVDYFNRSSVSIKEINSNMLMAYERYMRSKRTMTRINQLGNEVTTKEKGLSGSKRPVAVIRTKRVEIVKFRDISAEYAFIEGEGDKSLAYWKRVHWAFFMRELAPHGLKPTLEMELVCEYFETIWSEKR